MSKAYREVQIGDRIVVNGTEWEVTDVTPIEGDWYRFRLRALWMDLTMGCDRFGAHPCKMVEGD